MSEFTTDNARIRVMSGLTLDLSGPRFADAKAKLDTISPHTLRKAVGHALSRAEQSARTEAKRAIVKEYNLSGSMFLNYTHGSNRYQWTADGVQILVGFAGRRIPLVTFSVAGDEPVQVDVRKSTGRQVLDHAFYQTMKGHFGIYERTTKNRYPVKELYGPATPQMMAANEQVQEMVEKKVGEAFEKRIDHEITRLLNGWGDS